MSRPLEAWERQETLDRMHGFTPIGAHRYDELPSPRPEVAPIQTVKIPYRALAFRMLCRDLVQAVHDDPSGWASTWLIETRDLGMCPGCDMGEYSHQQGCPIAMTAEVAIGLGNFASGWPDSWRAS